MALKPQHYPMSPPPVKREGEPPPELRPRVTSAARAPGTDGAVDPPALLYRLLNYKDIGELRAFVSLLYAISAEADPFAYEHSAEFIDRMVLKALREENPSNTFAALVLERREIVAVHVLRRFEEGPLVGAQVSGLWVTLRCRRRGIARQLKAMGEAWARSIGANFLNTNVLSQNAAMLELNRELGFENYRVNLRKRL